MGRLRLIERAHAEILENTPPSDRAGAISAEWEHVEQDLRRQLYTALSNLTSAPAAEKAGITARMRFICRLLHEVVVESATAEWPERQAVSAPASTRPE
jgi:hypothetical protein